MRVLHVVKTSDGAGWAAFQAAELVRYGVEVHVALPSGDGRMVAEWRQAGVQIHVVPMDFPVRAPWRLPGIMRTARALVRQIQPDLIHSHFVGTTLTLRLALGLNHPVPRVFQVAGPLHLEHVLYRNCELIVCGPSDWWIGSSRCICERYSGTSVPAGRLFLSYYGTRVALFDRSRTDDLRSQCGLAQDDVIVGNVNYMYPPKFYLGQTIGLKCHEDVIDAIAMAHSEDHRIKGVLAGGAWGKALWYERHLRRRAERSGAPIVMLGAVPYGQANRLWPDFDLAVHVPLSENCGGVVEPLMAGVPVIAARTGGLPEVIIPNRTGVLVPRRNPRALADAILTVLRAMDDQRRMAFVGRQLVRVMFDVQRTAQEVHAIYRTILNGDAAPQRFSSEEFVASITKFIQVGACQIAG